MPWRHTPAVVCAALAFQSAAFVLLRSHLQDSSCNETILLWGELMKLVVAAAVLLATPGGMANVLHKPLYALFPVASFAAMNLLSFWALQHLRPNLAVVLIQLKLFFTAGFSRMILETEVPFARKTALVALLLGILGVVQAPHEGYRVEAWDHLMQFAIAALVVEAMLSGLTSVYMQHIFEDERSVWARNFQLALLSLPLYGVRGASQGCGFALGGGAGWMLAAVSAAGGILVALSTLYAGAIGKAVRPTGSPPHPSAARWRRRRAQSAAAAIALTVVLEHAFVLVSWPSAAEAVPVLAVLNAVVQYGLSPATARRDASMRVPRTPSSVALMDLDKADGGGRAWTALDLDKMGGGGSNSCSRQDSYSQLHDEDEARGGPHANGAHLPAGAGGTPAALGLGPARGLRRNVSFNSMAPAGGGTGGKARPNVLKRMAIAGAVLGGAFALAAAAFVGWTYRAEGARGEGGAGGAGASLLGAPLARLGGASCADLAPPSEAEAGAAAVEIDIFDLREEWHWEQQARLLNHFRDYIAAGAPAAGEVTWRVHSLLAADALVEGGPISAAPAGSVVLVSSHALLDNPALAQHEVYDADRLRRSPRAWALLNASRPLLVFLDNDGTCNAEGITEAFDATHHVVFRNTWSAPLHAAWARQAARAAPASLRAFPYGTYFYSEGMGSQAPHPARRTRPTRRLRAASAPPAAPARHGLRQAIRAPHSERNTARAAQGLLHAIGAPSPPADERPLLFSFRGTVGLEKPSRGLLRDAEAAHRAEWVAAAERLMRGSRAAPPAGLGRYYVDVKTLDEGAEYARDYDYLQLLHDSVFSLSPPGDLWEAYRTWEAMEAGSLPVVVNNASYKAGACARPATHMLATMPFVVAVDSWEELPAALAAAMANFSHVKARQQQMRDWLKADKTALRTQVLGLARWMQSGRWRPRTRCALRPLSPAALAAQQNALAAYWRKPQPLRVSEWSPNIMGPPMQPRSFSGAGGFCADGGEDFSEQCVTQGCGPPLVEALECAPIDALEATHARRCGLLDEAA